MYVWRNGILQLDVPWEGLVPLLFILRFGWRPGPGWAAPLRFSRVWGGCALSRSGWRMVAYKTFEFPGGVAIMARSQDPEVGDQVVSSWLCRWQEFWDGGSSGSGNVSDDVDGPGGASGGGGRLVVAAVIVVADMVVEEALFQGMLAGRIVP